MDAGRNVIRQGQPFETGTHAFVLRAFMHFCDYLCSQRTNFGIDWNTFTRSMTLITEIHCKTIRKFVNINWDSFFPFSYFQIFRIVLFKTITLQFYNTSIRQQLLKYSSLQFYNEDNIFSKKFYTDFFNILYFLEFLKLVISNCSAITHQAIIVIPCNLHDRSVARIFNNHFQYKFCISNELSGVLIGQLTSKSLNLTHYLPPGAGCSKAG